VDFDFFATSCYAPDPSQRAAKHHNKVDGHDVPVPHFGVVLEWNAWHELAERLRRGGVEFVIEPGIRLPARWGTGHHVLLRFLGNALEFKAFKDPRQLFAR
jgi:extradiol dioxygenase family protein